MDNSSIMEKVVKMRLILIVLVKIIDSILDTFYTKEEVRSIEKDLRIYKGKN